MKRTQYFVVQHNGEWKITLNGKHYGPYATQKAALKEAMARSFASLERPPLPSKLSPLELPEGRANAKSPPRSSEA